MRIVDIVLEVGHKIAVMQVFADRTVHGLVELLVGIRHYVVVDVVRKPLMKPHFRSNNALL